MFTQPTNPSWLTHPAPRYRPRVLVAAAAIVVGGMLAVSACAADDASTSSDQMVDTPADQLDDLAIGTPVTVDGATVTVNSVQPGPETLGQPTLEVAVSYENNSGSLLSITPYDWSTVLSTGSDKAHVGGDVSFRLDNLSDGEDWSGVVTLWGDDSPQKIKFESSSINLGRDSRVHATWLIPQE